MGKQKQNSDQDIKERKDRALPKIVLFLAIFAALFMAVSAVFTPKWNYPESYESVGMSIDEFRSLGQDDPQAFFIGTSHIQYAVDPMRLYEETGIVSYNMATSRQPAAASCFFVKEIFKYGYKPKVIVWDVSNLFQDTLSELAYRYVLDRYAPSENWYMLAREFIGNQIRTAEADGEEIDPESLRETEIGVAVPLYKYHSRWDELGPSDFHLPTGHYFLQGHYMSSYVNGTGLTDKTIEEQGDKVRTITHRRASGYRNGEEFSGRVDDIDAPYLTDVSDANLEYLKEVEELCRENNCQLLLVKIPVHDSAVNYDSSWTTERHEAISEIAEEEGLTFLDLNTDGPDIDWETESRDRGRHLNVRGSEKITDYLGSYLKMHYDLAVNDESSYKAREADYDRYKRIAWLESSTDLEEYAGLLAEKFTGENLSIYISVKDDMCAKLTKADRSALHKLGLQTTFSKMKATDSYIAVIHNGEAVYESRSNRLQTYSENMEAADSGEEDTDSVDQITGRASAAIEGAPAAHIESGGYWDGRVSSIIIDGKEYSNNSKGINIVVYDHDADLVIDSVTFNTCADPHTCSHSQQEALFKYANFLIYGDAES